MPRTVVNLVVMAGVMSSMGASSLSGQQQVRVTVAAVTNPIPPGSCTRLVTDVRDELNRQLTLENGAPLQWSNYDFTSSNGVDFEWRGTPAGEYELCAKPGAGAANTQVTATIKGMPYNGSTVVAVAAAPAPASVPGQPNVAPPTAGPAQAGAAAGAAGAAQGAAPPQAQAPTAAAGAAAAAPGAAGSASSVPGYAPAAAGAAAGAPGSAPAASASAASAAPAAGSAAGAAAGAPGYASAPAQGSPAGAAPAPPQQAQAAPVKSAGGLFKMIGSHIKQKAAQVKTETTQNLALAATQVVDTTFQTGSRLVASTTAEVSNTARMGIGGVGQKLMLAPQRGGGSADNLALAVASGRAVLLEMRFAAGTDVLEPAARDLAQRLAVELRAAMTSVAGSKFVIEAHVDSAPNAQVLSEYRAAAVKKALAAHGVDATRLIALGYGTSRPLQQGEPPTARIEIVRVQ